MRGKDGGIVEDAWEGSHLPIRTLILDFSEQQNSIVFESSNILGFVHCGAWYYLTNSGMD